MALFGKADAHIYLVNQYYQLVFDWRSPEGSELEEWLKFLRGPLFRSPNDVKEVEEDKAKQENALMRLSRHHDLIALTMNAAADGLAPSLGDEFNLNALIKEVMPPPVVAWTRHEVLKHRPLVSYDGSLGSRVGPAPLMEEKMLTTIVAQLVSALAANVFVRCTECGSAFASNRKEQKYCSYRCAHRAGTRRRRKNQAELASYL